MQNNILKVMEGHRLVPVVTFNTIEEVAPFVDYLLSENVRCIEVTLRTPVALEAIKAIKSQYGEEMTLGVGTVQSAKQAFDAANAGVDFMVSPGTTLRLIEGMRRTGVAFLPGVATPSEVMLAKEMGLNTLKFFPANLYGGKSALKAFGQLFPDVKFCPTGGVTPEIAEDYLDLSNVFAVGGSWFQKDFNEQIHRT